MGKEPVPPAAICPTTGHSFAPTRYRVQRVCGHCFLWVCCPCCDAHGRPFTDPDFDSGVPQIHCVELLMERTLGSM